MRYLSPTVAYATALLCVTFLGAGCAQTPAPSPTPATSTTPTVVFPETAPLVRPRPTGTVCDPQNFICVPASLVNSYVQSPVVASGTAIAFENTLQWKLLASDSSIIGQGTLTAAAPDIGQPGAFNLVQGVSIPGVYTAGTLRFYEASAQDGSPIHVLDIPVTL